jgi:uncharacterized SAM-dependent methyltransferase
VGNFEREAAQHFLRRLAAELGPRDRLLIGIDLRKDPRALLAAYDDARGVTARFNLNVLARINRELGGRFVLERFRHVASYDEQAGRVSMFLESLVAQEVQIDALALRVTFARGERIHTEDSIKYSAAEIEALAHAARMRIDAAWLDRQGRFSLDLFVPARGAAAQR